MFIGTGFLVLLVAIIIKLWRQNSSWPGAIIWFVAGATLAGSTLGILAVAAGKNGIQIGNTVVQSVNAGLHSAPERTSVIAPDASTLVITAGEAR